MGRRALAFVSAAIATYILATVAVTQGNLGYLASLGREITFGERVGAIGHDLLGMIGMFGPIVLVTLLFAYGVVALIVSRAPALRMIGYIAGGFAGMVAVHLILQAVFGMAPVWAARDAFGMLLQGLAGAVGGYVFYRMTAAAVANR